MVCKISNLTAYLAKSYSLLDRESIVPSAMLMESHRSRHEKHTFTHTAWQNDRLTMKEVGLAVPSHRKPIAQRRRARRTCQPQYAVSLCRLPSTGDLAGGAERSQRFVLDERLASPCPELMLRQYSQTIFHGHGSVHGK
jgi:hypothetical protein